MVIAVAFYTADIKRDLVRWNLCRWLSFRINKCEEIAHNYGAEKAKKSSSL